MSADAQALDRYARSGADLTKLQRVVFRLRFPDAKSAAAAMPKLEALAFEPMREPPGATAERVVLAAKTMYLNETDLRGLRDKLDVIAAEGGGRYEAWQATPKAPMTAPAGPR